MIVKTQLATKDVPFGVITILNVKNVSTIELIYKESYEEYLKLISDEKLQKIKSTWNKNYYNSSMTNFGMSLLLYQNSFWQSEFKNVLFLPIKA